MQAAAKNPGAAQGEAGGERALCDGFEKNRYPTLRRRLRRRISRPVIGRRLQPRCRLFGVPVLALRRPGSCRPLSCVTASGAGGPFGGHVGTTRARETDASKSRESDRRQRSRRGRASHVTAPARFRNHDGTKHQTRKRHRHRGRGHRVRNERERGFDDSGRQRSLALAADGTVDESRAGKLVKQLFSKVVDSDFEFCARFWE